MTTIVLTAAMLLACVPASAGLIIHTGSGTYNYPSLTAAGDSVWAKDSTTVNLLTGGEISGNLLAYDTSTVNVSDGMIGGGLWAWDNSTVNVSGGTICGSRTTAR